MAVNSPNSCCGLQQGPNTAHRMEKRQFGATAAREDSVSSLANMRSLLSSSGTSVLVVDDSPAMLRYLRVLLELERYNVETANNGAEALQRLKEGSPAAIVLLDVEMPGMDGLKTLRQLRRLRPDVKVIMCSGVEDPRTARRASRLGAEAFITKPIQHLYLSAAMERCLQAKAPTVVAHSSLKANVVKMPPRIATDPD